MKKFIIFFFLIFVETIYAACDIPPTLTCRDGHCILSGSGDLTIQNGNLNITTLTVMGGGDESCGLRLTAAQGSRNIIGKIIIQRKTTKNVFGQNTTFQLALHSRGYSELTIGDIVMGEGVNESNVAHVRFGPYGTIKLENTNLTKDATGAYIPRKEASGGSSGGNTGGEVIIPPNATPEETIEAVLKYAQSLNEQIHLESTNTLILYNILNNYDGTYINYDYGLGHQVGVGAFNNGGFFRYSNYNGKNGFDIGAKLKIKVANRLYLRGVAYYTYFGSGTLASHSLVFGLGVLKNIDFPLGSSSNVFWVLNPSANMYYATTLKGTYMPANHLGFGNVALDTGVRIKNTSLLLRGSVGGALNSLKSINIDLGNNASYKNTTFFNNALYSASFVFSQKFPLQRNNGRLYLNADIGGVFVNRVLVNDKPYILKAGMLLGYEFGGDAKRDNNDKATRQSSRYQKLKNNNARKTLTTPTSNQTATNNKRATNLMPKSDNTNTTKSTTPTTQAKTPTKDSSKATNNTQTPAKLTRAEKKAQKQAQKEQKAQKKAQEKKAAKSTPAKSTLPKINLPKVQKSSTKSSDSTKATKQTPKQSAKPIKSSATKSSASTKPATTKPANAKSSNAKSAKQTPTKTTAKSSKSSISAKPTKPTKPTPKAAIR